MELKQLDIYFVQEKWLEDNVFDEIINEYHIFCHNGGLGNHDFRGVAIILSPHYHEGWKAAGAQLPITTKATSEFAGQFISINVMLASNNRVGKQIQGNQDNKHLALTLASIYHPCTKTGDEKMYLCFLNALGALLNQLPAKLEIIMGININSNIGALDDLHSTKFHSALGLHGIPKCNKKGKNLLHIYLAHHLHVMNTFFETRSNNLGHSTWISNPLTSSGTAYSHLLDVIVCSVPLHKRIHNCCTILDRLDSDHRAVCMDLNLTSIKYKTKS
jgi:exonuclease III